MNNAMMTRTYAFGVSVAILPSSSYDPGITPNWDFLPFMGVLSKLVGSTVASVLLGLVGVIAISALAWGAGHIWDHGRASQVGKAGVAIGFVAAFVTGGASALVKWAAELGSWI